MGEVCDFYADGDALGEADPFEGWVDVGQEVRASAAIRLGDAPADAFYFSMDHLIGVGHEGHDHLIADVDPTDLGFRKVGVNPEA